MVSKILKTVHQTAKGLAKAGVMDKRTMHEFDALCFPRIKRLKGKSLNRSRASTSVQKF